MTCHPSPLLTENPWNLFHLLTQDDSVVHEWCRQNGVLSTGFSCSVDDCSGLVAMAGLSLDVPGTGVIPECRERIYSLKEQPNSSRYLLFTKFYL